jgi:hypothetical protein
MQLVKEYNGAITLRDVLESHPVLESIMLELHDNEVSRINRINTQGEALSIQRSMRGR